MQNPISPEELRAAAELAIVLDQHRFGAAVIVVIVLLVVLALIVRARSEDHKHVACKACSKTRKPTRKLAKMTFRPFS